MKNPDVSRVRCGQASVGISVPVRSICIVLVLVIVSPSVAAAYVDPGIVGMLFQAIFVFVFGFFLTVVTKPVRIFKRMLTRLGLRKDTEDGVGVGDAEVLAEETPKLEDDE